jgi:hypothetical protein
MALEKTDQPVRHDAHAGSVASLPQYDRSFNGTYHQAVSSNASDLGSLSQYLNPNFHLSGSDVAGAGLRYADASGKTIAEAAPAPEQAKTQQFGILTQIQGDYILGLKGAEQQRHIEGLSRTSKPGDLEQTRAYLEANGRHDLAEKLVPPPATDNGQPGTPRPGAPPEPGENPIVPGRGELTQKPQSSESHPEIEKIRNMSPEQITQELGTLLNNKDYAGIAQILGHFAFQPPGGPQDKILNQFQELAAKSGIGVKWDQNSLGMRCPCWDLHMIIKPPMPAPGVEFHTRYGADMMEGVRVHVDATTYDQTTKKDIETVYRGVLRQGKDD